MELLESFITPIIFEDKQDFLKDLINKTDPLIKESKKRNKNSFTYPSPSLMSDKNFRYFHDYVGKKSSEFLFNCGYDIKSYKLVIVESWVQEFSKTNGYHNTHLHSNTHVNGFYFLKCSNKTSYPIFHDPRAIAKALHLKKQKTEGVYPADDKVIVKPTPGTLVLFPGYLEHEFILSKEKDTFRFMHFNIQAIPNGI
jgi:uncharacterized protein (TIGR02466 family)